MTGNALGVLYRRCQFKFRDAGAQRGYSRQVTGMDSRSRLPNERGNLHDLGLVNVIRNENGLCVKSYLA